MFLLAGMLSISIELKIRNFGTHLDGSDSFRW